VEQGQALLPPWQRGVRSVAVALFRRGRKSDLHSKSLARSVPAQATVVTARQTTRTSQDVNSSSEVYEVVLDVQRADGNEPMRRTVQWTVFAAAVPDVQAGSKLAVSLDPERPAIVYPPGYPPPGHKPGVISLAEARILPTSSWLDSQLA
jgi:hypothetical protein